MIYLIIVVFILLAMILFLLKPRIGQVDFSPFLGWDYAHRGLYDNSGAAPENSLPAYALAVQHGYGIEFDIRMTKDRQLVLIHDPNLLRTSGIDKKIENLTYAELKKYRLFDSQASIPTLTELLSLVDGKVPLIVEIKSENAAYQDLCQRVCETLDSYYGPFMVESFNPLVLAYFKKYRPRYIRGQLSGGLSDKKGMKYFAIRYLLTNVLARPDFIAYEEEYQNNLALRLIQLVYRIPLIVYTVKSPVAYTANRKRFALQIFEGFRP